MRKPSPAGQSRRGAAVAATPARLDPPLGHAALAELLVAALPAAAADALMRTVREDPGALADLARSLIPAQRREPAPDDAACFAGLPAPTRWLLLLAAADEEMDTTCLVQLARASELDIDALAPAELAGLVRVAGGEVTFPRPGVRAMIYEQAPLAQRREAHLRIADAARATACFDRASTALVRAAELTSRGEQAGARLVTAAHYAWLSGSPDRARALLRRARAAAPSGAGDGERQLVAGEIELRSGAAENAVDTLLAAADALAGSQRELAVRALMRAGEAVCFSGNHPRYAEIAPRAESLRRPREPEQLEIVFAHIAGFADTFTGRHSRAVEPLRRCVALGARLDDPSALVLSSTASMLLADHVTAWRFAQGAVEASRASGDLSLRPLALLFRGKSEFFLGRYAAAEATCREGAQAAEACGQANYAGDHLGMLAVLAAIQGHVDECRQRLGRLAIPPGTGRLCRPIALSQWAQAVLDLLGGRTAEAVGRLISIADLTTGYGQGAVQFMATPWLVEAAARGAGRAPAMAVLYAFDQWAGSTGGPLVRALSARCHALLAPRGSAAAEEYFQEALRLHAESESEFERARTGLLFGQELRRGRRPRDAREHLHAAGETFRRLGLPLWADRADAELRAAGEQVETATQAAVLTAQQHQIAQLVAAGATNREVAARLFVSPRTVDHHLRNIFTKLQIRSRVELARLFPGA